MIRSVTASGFSPKRISTAPPTASSPSFSKTLRRYCGPICTTATFLTKTGVPDRSVTTVSSMSFVLRIQPTPRTRYSALFFWMVRPPTAELLRATASYKSASVTP